MSQIYDYVVKLILIGDSGTLFIKAFYFNQLGVGKSSFVLKFCDNTFKTNVMSTVGVDFKIKRLTLDGLTVKLQMVSFIV